MSTASVESASPTSAASVQSLPPVAVSSGNRQIAVAFLRTAQGTMTLTALPWLVIAAGGKESDVGLTGTVVTVTYLVSCLAAPRIGKALGRQRLVIAACLPTLLILASMAGARSISVLLLLVGLFGVTAGMFWPALVGWLSAGQHGDALNRRLSRFNATWSAGGIAGTLVAGPLLQVRPWLPFVTAAVVESITITIVATAPRPPEDSPESTSPAGSTAPASNAMLRVAALVFAAAWLGMGVLRYPLVSAIKALSLGPRTHSVIAAALSLTLTVVFYFLGRSNRWQRSPGFVVGAGLVAAAALGGIALCSSGWTMGALVVTATAGMAVGAQADMYWRTSKGSDRTASMAAHEVLSSTVFAIGSYGGGWVGTELGITWAFPAAAALMGIALLGAVIAALRVRRDTCDESVAAG